MPAKRKATSSGEGEDNKRNIKTKTVCSCCGKDGKTVSGCSCQGGTSHQCLQCLPTPLPLTTATSPILTEALSPYFNELKLADIVYNYLVKACITTWQVSDAAGLSITLPLQSAGPIDFFVQWGDGSANRITSYDQAEVVHTYAEAGGYIVHMDGLVCGFAFGNYHPSRDKIVDISQWGCMGLGNEGKQFFGCSNLNVSAVDEPDLSRVTNMIDMFLGASSLNCDLSRWNTRNVINMYGMFFSARAFNSDISGWSTHNVTTMDSMFYGAASFNHEHINGWDLSSLTHDRDDMFR